MAYISIKEVKDMIGKVVIIRLKFRPHYGSRTKILNVDKRMLELQDGSWVHLNNVSDILEL